MPIAPEQYSQYPQSFLIENLEQPRSIPLLESSFLALLAEENITQQMYNCTLKRWKMTFDRDEFILKIVDYDRFFQRNSFNTANPTDIDDLFLYFKSIRKSALYFSTVLELFDISHYCPEELSYFTWSLGKFKDAYFMPELAVKYELALLDAVRSSSTYLQGIELHAADLDSVKNVGKERISSIKKLLHKDELSATKFHKLRKKLRVFSIFFTVATQLPEYHHFSELKDKLVEINDELGEINDQLTKEALRGIIKYDEHKVVLPTPIKQKIQLLLP